MTKKLEELFGFDQLEDNATSEPISETLTAEETKSAIIHADETIDKIDAALPGIRDLDTSDKELDDIADLAKESFQNLSDLGMNVDSRFSAELFAVAGTMLGHALQAKTTKLNKKLKMIDLQMKKLKLDQDALKIKGTADQLENMPTAEGSIMDRNQLLEHILGSREEKTPPPGTTESA
jgi:hypothetical protein